MFTGIVQAVGRVVEVRRPAAGGSDGVARIVINASGGGGAGGGGAAGGGAAGGGAAGGGVGGRGGWRHEAALGDSICVSGCCLTVAEEPAGPEAPLAFDAMPETLRLTTLGRLVLGGPLALQEGIGRGGMGEGEGGGARVNLERSVTPATLLGGHLVQGHVEGVGRVASIQKEGGDWRVRIAVPEQSRDDEQSRDRQGAVGREDSRERGSGSLIECITPKGSITVEGVSLTVASVDRTSFEVALIPTTLEKTTLADLREGDGVNLETDILARTVVHWLRTYGRNK